MSLRARVILSVLVVFAALAGLQLLVQQRILLPSFAALEREDARRNMDRVSYALARELDLVAVSALNWGNWVDTWNYMRDRNPEYVKGNLYPEAIRSMKVDALALIGTDGTYVFTAAYEPASGKPMQVDLFARGVLPAGEPWQSALHSGKALKGFVATNLGPMLIAMCPILEGKGVGPNRGAALLGRLLTRQEIERIGVQNQVQLSAVTAPVDPAQRPPMTDHVLELSDATQIDRSFADVHGHPVLTLRTTLPRAISARGRRTVNYALVFLSGAGTLVLLALLLVLNRSILKPLTRITRYAVAVGEGRDPPRLALARRDELGSLALEFERMLERLHTAQRELVDRSFRSGLTEMASGTLHNIGNAMTPLSVHVGALEDCLTAAPVDDVLLAARELQEGGEDPARSAELAQFLALTGQDLESVLRRARSQLATISRLVQGVQEVLEQQRDVAPVSAVHERIGLRELLERATELVPPAQRERLQIEIDAEPQALEPLPLPRLLLQQVLQNVLINAAEALPCAQTVRGRVRISATLEDRLPSRVLRLCVQDAGTGIEPENLARIFERGFSTKSRATNSGVGLHWCANALNAAGGSIRATSAGPGCGAAFEILLPVAAAADPLLEVA